MAVFAWQHPLVGNLRLVGVLPTGNTLVLDLTYEAEVLEVSQTVVVESFVVREHWAWLGMKLKAAISVVEIEVVNCFSKQKIGGNRSRVRHGGLESKS